MHEEAEQLRTLLKREAAQRRAELGAPSVERDEHVDDGALGRDEMGTVWLCRRALALFIRSEAGFPSWAGCADLDAEQLLRT